MMEADSRLVTLAREYLWYIAEMASGNHDADARRQLASGRSIVHDELIRALGAGYERPFDMQAFARQLLSETS